MDRKTKRVIRTFVAKAQDGSEHTVRQWQEFIQSKTRGGIEEVEGLKWLEFAADGEHLNYVSQGVYEDLIGRRYTCPDGP